MKISPRNLLSVYLLSISTFLSCLLAVGALAEPIEFNEVSLLVRAQETDASIKQEVAARKLVRALNPQQEAKLKAQGASDSLVQALRAPAIMLGAAEATAFETRREQMRKGNANTEAAHSTSMDEQAPGLHVFEVSVGHPVNLSQWGGPDYELAFHAPTRLDEGREDAIVTDNVVSGTHVSTYLGAGRAEDSTTIFDRRNYVSVMNHSFTRSLWIDHKNPVLMKGSPYTFYPVYAAGGVSLYYIGGSSSSVKLAVLTAAR